MDRSSDFPPWRGWVAYLLGTLFFGYGFILRVSPSVMVNELMAEFVVGATVVGILTSLYFYTYASLQLPVGVFMDRFGPRRLIGVAILLCAAGSALFAIAPQLNVAYAGRLMIGAGAAFSYVGAMTIAARWFPSNRFALLVGIIQMMGMAGAIFGQAPLGAAIASVGWRSSLMFVAVAGLVLATLVFIFVRDQGPHSRVKQGDDLSIFAGMGHVMRNRQSWYLAIIGMVQTGPMLAFAGLWAVPFLMSCYELSKTEASTLASVMFVGWGVSAPIAGWASDRIKSRKIPLLTGVILAIVSIVIVTQVEGLPIWLIILLLFVNGVGGSTMVVTFAAGREANPIDTQSTTMGFINMCVVASGAFYPALMGWILDNNWGGVMINSARVYEFSAYSQAAYVMIAGYLVGLVAALLVKESHCQQYG